MVILKLGWGSSATVLILYIDWIANVLLINGENVGHANISLIL